MSGLTGYLAADGASKKFDMVDGGNYDGDKACKFICAVLTCVSFFFAFEQFQPFFIERNGRMTLSHG